jgi:hypothetical protein
MSTQSGVIPIEMANKAADKHGRRVLVRLFIWVIPIAFTALMFRIYLDQSAQYLKQPYLDRFYAGYMPRLLAEKPFWYFLLPIPEFKGVWATTGFVPIYFLEAWFGSNAAFLLLTTCATLAFGYGCWLISRRILPSAFAAFALAFSPFNYSVYLWNGSNNVYAMIIFLSLATGFFASYVLHEGRRMQLLSGAGFLVLAALSYEAWLGAVAILGVLSWSLLMFLSRHEGRDLSRRYVVVASYVFSMAVIYSLVRMQTLKETAIQGLEFQFVWDHNSFAATFDDLAYHLVFLFYLCISQILPGPVGASLAIYQSGTLDIAALQQGYQPDLYQVVAGHYLNLWLMYAGGAFVGVAVVAATAIRTGMRTGARGPFVAGILLTGVLIGSPTHAMLKFVAFNGVPFYGYKVAIPLMILLFGVGLLIDGVARRISDGRWRLTFLGVAIVYVLVVAFTRPAWVNENVLEVWGAQGFFGNGFYPDPWANLKATMGTLP